MSNVSLQRSIFANQRLEAAAGLRHFDRRIALRYGTTVVGELRASRDLISSKPRHIDLEITGGAEGDARSHCVLQLTQQADACELYSIE